jgi:aryl sulfotransferase
MLVEYKTPIADNSRWENFVHRPNDIFVCTPAKCGTTWTQTIVNSLLFPDGDSPGPVLVVSPWLEMQIDPIEVILDRLDQQTHRRCIKSHTPADGIPWFEDAKYIVVGRDGRDAFMSWVNHNDNMRRDVIEGLPPPRELHEMYPDWIASGALFHHIATFWEKRGQPNLLFVHYGDMKRDLEGEMRRIAAFLDIEIPDHKWPAVVERCTFESMKDRSEEIAKFDMLFKGGADTFLFKGTNERWRGVLTDDELAAYDKRVGEMLPPDAAAWLEGGRAAL